MHGIGIFTWPDGKKYIGQYRKDKKWGYGVFIFSDSKVWEGAWYDGKQHGIGITIKKNSIQPGEWRMGKKIRALKLSDDEINTLIPDEIRNIMPEIKLIEESMERPSSNTNSHSGSHVSEPAGEEGVNIEGVEV